MTCKMCRERVKDWKGDDPVCAFPNGAPFAAENWNCATANAIRDLCEAPVYADDQYHQTLPAYLPVEGALALWVSWYKRRGRTDAMWLLSECQPPRLPTEAECLAIIASAQQ